jgi:hypothetical protein
VALDEVTTEPVAGTAVSGPMSACISSPSTIVTVRHTPLTATLSPSDNSEASDVLMRAQKPDGTTVMPLT